MHILKYLAMWLDSLWLQQKIANSLPLTTQVYPDV